MKHFLAGIIHHHMYYEVNQFGGVIEERLFTEGFLEEDLM